MSETFTQKIFAVGVLPGLGCGLMYCASIFIVTVYFEKKRSLATGITVCGTAVGTVSFAHLIQSIENFVNKKYIIPIFGGMMIII